MIFTKKKTLFPVEMKCHSIQRSVPRRYVLDMTIDLQMKIFSVFLNFT